MVDMAHIAGLVAGGVHPSPIPHADVTTFTTHKTLRGPRGAMALTKKSLRRKYNSAVFPNMQGGPMEHAIAGKAVAFKEAMQPEFKDYANQVVQNSKALASGLDAGGLRIVDSKLFLYHLRHFLRESGLPEKPSYGTEKYPA